MGRPSMEIKRKKRRRQKRQQNTRRVKICGVGVKASNDSLEETHTYVNDTFPHNSTDSSSVTNDIKMIRMQLLVKLEIRI